MLIDLHTHSRASDGTDAPADLMRAAADAGLDVVALTDHDTARGWGEAADAVPETGVVLVRGTEISCSAAGISVHLLSYLHDPDEPELLAALEAARASRDARARRMVELVAQRYPLTWDDVAAHVGPDATVGRPHLADALVAAGYVADREEAFADVLSSASPYYVRYSAPDAVAMVAVVRRAGGVPVFAHPRADARGRIVDASVVRDMAHAGLAGLEVDHRDHTDAARETLRALAAELGLLVTGSSDYHGAGKPNRLGEHTTSRAVLAAIEEQGRLALVRP
ncbi:PHP domain protein [Beutenbergia cavernae DSM 12333]|uniref:PHP domain protein n=1 Tax=Beutenbergia cavernae (strain ATCC BAA-8 / DSM 12333 / CCUG 43141 / JCM 11478 / NBRC 16432 / NCIMB 13614 / HKI 0122) TaxID=471853 RepID=C5BZ39_BEUC1|nr:PHP domain-containing protein [Beutenbergia cavernae]ACQ81154.1 PHP domain protein [Beutenbergia cavernae DSM 12333]